MCLALGAISDGTRAVAEETGRAIQRFNVPSMLVRQALEQVARKTGHQLIVSSELGETLMSSPVIGDYSVLNAIAVLLDGTGLTGSLTEGGVIVVHYPEAQTKTTDGETGMNVKKQILAAALGASLASGIYAADMKDARKKGLGIEEVVVTATRRETSLQDTPMSITAITGDVIEKRGLMDMTTYLNSVPGVTMQDRGGLGNSIVVRGIAVEPGTEKEAVGVYFGETPLAGLTNAESGFANLKFVDIERVEVLRGPQGTLYGSGSMGGAVRIAPKQPYLERVDGKLLVGLSQTDEQGSDNSSLEGVLNLPVIPEKLALRAVVYKHDNSGYIENIAGSYSGPGNVLFTENFGGIARDQSDIGATETKGVRVSALWQASENLSFTLSGIWQEDEQRGSPQINPNLPGDYQQTRPIGAKTVRHYFSGHEFYGYEGNEAEINIANLIINYDMEWGTLFSTSSWVDQKTQQDRDVSHSLNFVGNYFDSKNRDRDFFFQEIRFVSNFDGPIQLVGGFFYEDKSQVRNNGQVFLGGNHERELELVNTLAPAVPEDAPQGFTWQNRGLLDAYFLNSFDLTQRALFGELTYKVTNNITTTIGIRDYKYDEYFFTIAQGLLTGNLYPKIISEAKGENSGQTYKFSIDWKINDSAMAYFSWSEGFRSGQTLIKGAAALYDPENTGYYTTPTGEKVPIRDQTDPDELENFELGLKSSFFDGLITLNASLYYIDWVGLPVSVIVQSVTNPELRDSTVLNAGSSVSEGVELESSIKLFDNFHIDLGASYNKTTLSKAQAGLGEKGDDLPGSADFTIAAGLEYSFNIIGNNAFARIDYNYVGEYESYINQPEAPTAGGYSQFHIKSGVEFGKASIDFYVKNLTNENDITYGDMTTVYRLRPRTFGLNVSYQF